MLMLVVKYVLIIGGVMLLIDAITSLKFIRDKRWFCQLVRVERAVFAIIVIAVGVWL